MPDSSSADPVAPPMDTVVMPTSSGINTAPDIAPVDITQMTMAERMARIESALNL